METQFYAIKGYEGSYEISKDGIIKSIERTTDEGRRIKEKILKQSKTGEYLQVCLSKNGKAKAFCIHQLIYLTFCGEYDTKKFEIDHEDQNKNNNKIENLRLLSKRGNQNNRKDQSIYGCGCHIDGSRFNVFITINKKQNYLGCFDTAEEANSKYLKTKELIENIDYDFYFKKVKTGKTEYSIEIFKK